MELLQDNEFSKVYFDTDLKAGVIEWKQTKLTSEAYRNSFEVLIEYTNGKDIFENYYSDGRLQSVVSPADRKWFQENIIPKAINNGLKRGAVLISGNAFKKYYMNMIIKGSRKFPIEIKIFDKEEKAIAWLKSF